MNLANTTLLCPNCNDTPIDVDVGFGFGLVGPIIKITLTCNHCDWTKTKTISLLRMMGKQVLCPKNDILTIG